MIVVFSSLKGGVGKSTLAVNLALLLKEAGRRVVLIDTDQNGSSAKWVIARTEGRRLDGGFAFFTAKPGKALLKSLLELNQTFDYVLVDLAGHGSEANNAPLEIADKVIFPAQPSGADLSTLVDAKAMLEEKEITNPKLRAYYVLTDVATNTRRPERYAKEYISSMDVGITFVQTVLHQRDAWRRSLSEGLAVFEIGDKKAVGELYGIASEIFDATLHSHEDVQQL